MLFVNEVFYSIQGEGCFTGTPAVFVRLQGCHCQCPWCDTKFTWKIPSLNTTSLEAIEHKLDRGGYASVEEADLVAFIASRWPQAPLVVITGGEPCLQPIRPLIERLERSGRRVQIETSGTVAISVTETTFVTVSPKVGMPGGEIVLPEALYRANEVKMVVGCEEDLRVFDALLPAIHPEARLSLQPLSTSSEATALCVETILARGERYHLSLQTHKWIGVR